MLLLAAGFAPAFPERALTELDAARSAIDRVLTAHKPYPASAVDRHWNVVLSNSAPPHRDRDITMWEPIRGDRR